MKKQKRRWNEIKDRKLFMVPFKKEYCVCGKRLFRSKAEAERFRLRELVDRGSKRKNHVYKCEESHHYHITYKEAQ